MTDRTQHMGEAQPKEEVYLPAEKLLFRLRMLYRQYGYQPYRMSKFEKYELYAGNKDFLVSDRVITFNDTNGDLLALKPDVTLSIVKGAQFQKNRVEKLYYQENVYRPSGSARQFREIMQCGLECIGDLDAYALYEVLRLAEKSLCEVSEECILSFSHLGILKALFQRLKAGEAQQAQLLALIAARNLHEITAMFERCGWGEESLQAVKKLLSLSCTVSDLPREMEALGLPWMDETVLRELKALASLSTGEMQRVRFDFSVINDIHYYNGLVFQGFVKGISEKILSGGRYDSLLARMNRKGAAAGFAIYLGLLEQLGFYQQPTKADVLLLYDRETDAGELKRTAEELRKQGRTVDAQRAISGQFAEILDMRREVQHA